MNMLSIKDFKLLQIIGKGNGSTVFKAKYNEENYALKATEKERATFIKTGVREKDILKGINHSFIINMLACFETSNHLCYLMEYAPAGDMTQVQRLHGGRIPEDHVQFYAAELSVAVNHLHSIGIIHRDIKPGNILVAADGHIKLTDFDSATDVTIERRPAYCGTFGYMAPEVLKNEIQGYEVDWWSVGATLYFTLHGSKPVCEKNLRGMTRINHIKIKFARNISEHAKLLLEGFLMEDPKERLGKEGLHEIKSHSFFVNMPWDKLEAKEIIPPFVPSIHNLPNITRNFLSEDFSLSESYRISRKDNPLVKFIHEEQFKDFYYINPEWK